MRWREVALGASGGAVKVDELVAGATFTVNAVRRRVGDETGLCADRLGRVRRSHPRDHPQYGFCRSSNRAPAGSRKR